MIGRLAIQDVSPVVDCGRVPAKGAVGEQIPISATVFRDGHDLVAADVLLRPPTAGARVRRIRMSSEGWDRFTATVTVDAPGEWTFQVEAYADDVGSLTHRRDVKAADGQDVANEEALLVEALARRGSATRRLSTVTQRFPIRVERERALRGAWYEMFPRSEGNLRTAAARLPAIAAMGFDVLYLPPIHPIGRAHRKGPNNSLTAGPTDCGSPWAVGGPEGGHDAIHPDLGTLADFDAFVAEAAALGLEVALDLALQCSPDHPWVIEHPEWFTILPDGTIAYAENPPKRYQDIYPLEFDNDREGLHAEVLRVVRHWISHGVRIFRVDNPHTKPLDFWQRLLADVATTDPDVVFLSEAFTKSHMMRALAAVGFQQSYTYFTWKTSGWELRDYLTELTNSPSADVLRPNLWVNTPDILHASLQHGGPPMFRIRAVLAAMAGPSWGVYSGYELCEGTAVREGSEEYLDSEKYQLRPRDWQSPHSIAPYLTRLNAIRREHPALGDLRNLRFHHVDNDTVLCFSKRRDDDLVIVIVTLDPHAPVEATAYFDMAALGLPEDATMTVRDEITGAAWEWTKATYVRLDPALEPAHIVSVAL